MWSFFDVQYDFRSSRLTVDCYAVEVRKLLVLIIFMVVFKVFGEVWHTSVLHKLKLYKNPSNRLLWVVLNGKSLHEFFISPFQANLPLLYPLKTSENLRFSDFFRGYRKETLTWNGLMMVILFGEKYSRMDQVKFLEGNCESFST